MQSCYFDKINFKCHFIYFILFFVSVYNFISDFQFQLCGQAEFLSLCWEVVACIILNPLKVSEDVSKFD